MQTVIELGRAIRDRRAKPIKLPLLSLVVVHADATFLADIAGELRGYLQEELNVREVETCADPLQYASVRAQPDFAVRRRPLFQFVFSWLMRVLARGKCVVWYLRDGWTVVLHMVLTVQQRVQTSQLSSSSAVLYRLLGLVFTRTHTS
jgi:hypothetical protein